MSWRIPHRPSIAFLVLSFLPTGDLAAQRPGFEAPEREPITTNVIVRVRTVRGTPLMGHALVRLTGRVGSFDQTTSTREAGEAIFTNGHGGKLHRRGELARLPDRAGGSFRHHVGQRNHGVCESDARAGTRRQARAGGPPRAGSEGAGRNRQGARSPAQERLARGAQAAGEGRKDGAGTSSIRSTPRRTNCAARVWGNGMASRPGW